MDTRNVCSRWMHAKANAMKRRQKFISAFCNASNVRSFTDLKIKFLEFTKPEALDKMAEMEEANWLGFFEVKVQMLICYCYKYYMHSLTH